MKIQELSFAYQDIPVLHQVSCTIPKNAYTVIIGHNGSGKSTLAKCLANLEKPLSGTIDLEQAKVGIVFQNPDNQFIGSTVADDIAFGLENHEFPPEKMQERIEWAASQVSMQAYLDKEPSQLSGGQKQRVAIAGILAMGLDLLIFDEATSMLDPQGKRSILSAIQHLRKTDGLTVISITHDMDEVALADHVVLLHEGRVAYEGKPEDLFQLDLRPYRLTAPFAWRFSQQLSQRGVIKQPVCTTEEVLEQLCPSISKD